MTVPSIIQEEILPGQILQAALQLYQKHGLKKVTMDDVAKAIGKSRSALYYYYKNKDEIFEAVMDALIGEIASEIGQSVNKAGSTENKFRAFCQAKIKTSEERKAIFQAMEAGMDVEERSTHARIMSDLHQRMMKTETLLLRKVLAEGIKKKEIRPVKPKEQETVVFIILSSVRGIKREMAHENDFSRLGVTIDTLTGMLMQWLRF